MSACCGAASDRKTATWVRRVREIAPWCSPECHLGVGAQVPGLPGSVRDALDRTRPVAFHGNLPADWVLLLSKCRSIAVSDLEVFSSHRDQLQTER